MTFHVMGKGYYTRILVTCDASTAGSIELQLASMVVNEAACGTPMLWRMRSIREKVCVCDD